MISQEAVEAFNSRVTVNVNNIKTMKPAELDRVAMHGTAAEVLLKNKDLALFIHQYKFEILDQLASIAGYTEEDNNRRVGLSNQLAGLDGFIASLQRALYMKNKVVTQRNPSVEPNFNNLKGTEVL
jgi:hypothetical protein